MSILQHNTRLECALATTLVRTRCDDPEFLRAYAALIRETRSAAYRTLLNDLQAGNAIFRQFSRWSKVVRFVQTGKVKSREDLDLVLVPIFDEIAHEMDVQRRQMWSTILFALFWVPLEKLCRGNHSWCNDSNVRRQHLAFGFAKAIYAVAMGTRRQWIARKLMNDSQSTLRKSCEEERRESSRAKRLRKKHETKSRALALLCTEAARLELAERFERILKDLNRCVHDCVITSSDFELLVATRLRGESLRDFGRNMGVSYEMAKKRRQRVERAIRCAFPGWFAFVMKA